MNERRCLMGIDLGLTFVKTGIFDTNGHCVGLGQGRYPLERPYLGWAEHDQNLWWSELIKTIKDARSEAKISLNKIVGIGVTGFGHGVSPVTRDGKLLTKCNTSQDQRAMKQLKWIKENTDIDQEDYGGKIVSSKILWLKENRLEIYKKTFKFLFPSSFVIFKLTGKYSADVDSFTIGDWSEITQTIGVPLQKLPEVHKPGEVVGEVMKKVAEETGLKEGTPVVAGAMDYACCLYGAGFVKPGRCVDLTGTVGGMTVAVAAKTVTGPHSFPIIPSIDRIRVAGSRTVGGLIRWFRDQFCQTEVEVAKKTGISEYQLIDCEAERVEPGSGGVFVTPHFFGKSIGSDIDRVGTIFGLTWTTPRERVIRALMEGWAYELRRGMEASALHKMGIKIEEVRAVGGGGRRRVWRQIKANVLGIPFSQINVDEAGCFGAAILAGVGVGLFKDFVSPIEEIVKVIERNEPKDEYRKRYDDLFQIYLKLNIILEQAGIYDQYFKILEKQKMI